MNSYQWFSCSAILLVLVAFFVLKNLHTHALSKEVFRKAEHLSNVWNRERNICQCSALKSFQSKAGNWKLCGNAAFLKYLLVQNWSLWVMQNPSQNGHSRRWCWSLYNMEPKECSFACNSRWQLPQLFRSARIFVGFFFGSGILFFCHCTARSHVKRDLFCTARTRKKEWLYVVIQKYFYYESII